MFSLQMLGGVAQLERALIAERTKAWLRAAHRCESWSARRWCGLYPQGRRWHAAPRTWGAAWPWGDVARVLNTVERLRRTARRLVSEGIVEATLRHRAPRQQSDNRLIRLVAGIRTAALDRTLQQIAAQLEAMDERSPRVETRWHPSSVEHQLVRAEMFGLAGAPPAQVDPWVWR
jgi:hypothetical protein